MAAMQHVDKAKKNVNSLFITRSALPPAPPRPPRRYVLLDNEVLMLTGALAWFLQVAPRSAISGVHLVCSASLGSSHRSGKRAKYPLCRS